MKKVIYKLDTILKSLGVIAVLLLAFQINSNAQVAIKDVIANPVQAVSTPGAVTTTAQLDDGSAEATIFVGGPEFIWFNHFSLPAGDFPLLVEEVNVLFAGGELPGDPIEIFVYEDPDGDPTNGATLLGSFPATVQVADGTTFSDYAIPAPFTATNGNNLYIGVVNRSPFVVAALDQTPPSQGRSWIGFGTAQPFPSNQDLATIPTLDLIDNFGLPGNWLIRVGYSPIADEAPIPTMSEWGLMIFGLLVVNLSVFFLRRKESILA